MGKKMDTTRILCRVEGDILRQHWRIKWERKWKLLEYYAVLKEISYPSNRESNGNLSGNKISTGTLYFAGAS